jgi:hypothetical protein
MLLIVKMLMEGVFKPSVVPFVITILSTHLTQELNKERSNNKTYGITTLKKYVHVDHGIIVQKELKKK